MTPNAMLEEPFQNLLGRYAEALGYKHYHADDSRKVLGKGYPDSVIVGNNRLIFAELKRINVRGKLDGVLSDAQREWFNDLINIEGAECYVWYPKDWQDIVHILDEGDRNNRTRITIPIPEGTRKIKCKLSSSHHAPDPFTAHQNSPGQPK